MSTNDEFVTAVDVLLDQCSTEKARLWYIAAQVLERMQAMDRRVASQPPAAATPKESA